MKLLGKKTDPPRFWLYQHVLACPACGGPFQPEQGDTFSHAGQAVQIDCPYCRRALFVWTPQNGQSPNVTLR